MARSLLGLDLIARVRLDQAGPAVGLAIDRDQAVETHADAAENTARRPAEAGTAPRAVPVGDQGGADALTGLRVNHAIVEAELEAHGTSSKRSGRNGARST